MKKVQFFNNFLSEEDSTFITALVNGKNMDNLLYGIKLLNEKNNWQLTANYIVENKTQYIDINSNAVLPKSVLKILKVILRYFSPFDIANKTPAKLRELQALGEIDLLSSTEICKILAAKKLIDGYNSQNLGIALTAGGFKNILIRLDVLKRAYAVVRNNEKPNIKSKLKEYGFGTSTHIMRIFL